jgi:tetratricopeptide (TPR) repeat protein
MSKNQISRALRRVVVAIVAASGVARPVSAQRAGTTMRDSVGDAAASLLNQGRANEARITLLRALRATRVPEELAVYRLEIGDTFLHEGSYQDAARAYNAVLSARDSVRVDSLVRWAHHGLALVDAFEGRTARAATHYAAALRGPSSLADTIEMLVMTAQHDSALKALDRYAATHHDAKALQFVQAYRGLSWMNAGHCTEALPEVAKAPQQNRPLLIAIRGRCAIKHGQRVDALAMRDSVLKGDLPDPFAWTALIARDTARKIE